MMGSRALERDGGGVAGRLSEIFRAERWSGEAAAGELFESSCPCRSCMENCDVANVPTTVVDPGRSAVSIRSFTAI